MTKEEIIQGNKLIAVVYQILNKVNGKSYIGSSARFERRRKRHLEDLKKGCHHCLLLQRAYNKYGADSFEILVLKRFRYSEAKDILKIEQFYLDSMNPEYNVCKTAGSQLGQKRDAKFKTRCSDRMKGKKPWNKGIKTGPQSHTTRAKRAQSMKGKAHTEETKSKISKKHKGRKFTEEHKEKLSKAKIIHGKYRRK